MAPIISDEKEIVNPAKNPPEVSGNKKVVPAWVNEENFMGLLEDIVAGFHQIQKFEVSFTAGDGENYTSIMLRVKAKVELEGAKTKDLAFVIKTLPQTDEGAKVVQTMRLFPKETQMYGELLPDFEKMLRDIGEKVTFGPKCYKLKVDAGVEYVLLEDLKPYGFKNVNRLEGLDEDHTKSVLRLLAKFHAVSAVRYQIKGEYSQAFQVGLFNESNRDIVMAMTKSISGIFLESLQASKISPECCEKLKTLLGCNVDMYIKLGTADPDEFNVIIHGDLWCNNVMFRYNNDGTRTDTIFVDFQICRLGSPAVDLFYFLLSSTKLELKVSRFDYFVKYYHDHLVENLKALNYSNRIPQLKDLHMSLLKNSFWAFSTIVGVMAAVLLDPSDKANIDNFLTEHEDGIDFKKQLYLNPRYISHIETIFPWLEERGYLDV